MNLQQKNSSIWQEVKDYKSPLLMSDLDADVCVVGAGISGLTTAYLLLKAGKTVAVFDKKTSLGDGETGFTSAHLSNALDDGYAQLKKWHGSEGARLAYESHTNAIDLIEQIASDENIGCEFQRVSGFLFLGPQDDMNTLKQEIEVCREIGFKKVQLLHRAPVNSFDSGPCLHYPDQAQFHPVKYLQGLARAIESLGGQIFFDAQVNEIKGGDQAHLLLDGGFKATCRNIVVATNVPVNDRFVIHTKEHAYRSYMLGMKVPHGEFSPLLLWDTEDPYHYVRLWQDPEKKFDVLLIGGEDHKTGQAPENEFPFLALKTWAEQKLHLQGELEAEIVYQWSGQIIEPVDGLAYIGRNPDDANNVYIATGDSGHGLTHGTIAGILIRDLILDRKNPWQELYNPKRLNYRSLGTFLKENINTGAQYADWVSGGEDDPLFNLQPDEGTVVRLGISKVAVYCDHAGNMQFLSAVCPHLGGIVHWNTTEKTWDCPCHGSRFNTSGQAINGPANEGLKIFEAVKTDNTEDVAAML